MFFESWAWKEFKIGSGPVWPDINNYGSDMWIKVCGFKNPDNCLQAVQAGIDAIGLNFFSGSKRFVDPDVAGQISELLRSSTSDTAADLRPRLCASSYVVDVVGLFVNSNSRDVIRIARQVGLTAIQFHGNESIDDILSVHAACPDIAVVRAFRLNVDHVSQMIDQMQDLWQAISEVAFLLDAFVPGQFGGTGQTVDTEIVSRVREALPADVRLILAGGLTPSNVSMLAGECTPWGVDTASGVESAPGVKSTPLVNQFVQAVRKLKTG